MLLRLPGSGEAPALSPSCKAGWERKYLTIIVPMGKVVLLLTGSYSWQFSKDSRKAKQMASLHRNNNLRGGPKRFSSNLRCGIQGWEPASRWEAEGTKTFGLWKGRGARPRPDKGQGH